MRVYQIKKVQHNTKSDLTMAEETTASTLLTRFKGYLKEAPFFCKIIELVKMHVIAILNKNF